MTAPQPGQEPCLIQWQKCCSRPRTYPQHHSSHGWGGKEKRQSKREHIGKNGDGRNRRGAGSQGQGEIYREGVGEKGRGGWLTNKKMKRKTGRNREQVEKGEGKTDREGLGQKS